MTRSIKRMLLHLAAAILVSLGAAGAANAYSVKYAGPKTWAAGWDAQSTFDTPYWWYLNGMYNKSCGIWDENCYARVAFIRPDGSWRCSVTDWWIDTTCDLAYGFEYLKYHKKAYCKNNSIYTTYTAYCAASRTV